ncbi:MAG: putative metal-binding motif-containing protein [Deltaproteobacteria bacterium]|nr:putative metal-binding motif-containing protein [Deltaproteobacteria bacterium]
MPGQDPQFACIQLHIPLCRPCAGHDDCTAGGIEPRAFCRALGGPNGSFCVTECGDGKPCGDGYLCDSTVEAPGGAGSFCVPVTGACGCSDWSVEHALATPCSRTNDAGTCAGARTCRHDRAGANGLSACDAPEPRIEECNGSDDDCDGQTDEGFSGQESCNGIDDDCDGKTDEEGAAECRTRYLDADGDGYGVETDFRCLCTPEGSYRALAAGDCYDSEASVYPKAPERCDGLDNDCDGGKDPPGSTDCKPWYLDEDGDGFGDPYLMACLCGPSGKYASLLPDDCDDSEAAARPGAIETCDGLDNDCDGAEDEGSDEPCQTDCGSGTRPCDGGKLGDCTAPPLNHCVRYDQGCAPFTTCAACPPEPPESCNGEDDDCDGVPDDGVQTAFWRDADGDGWGDPDDAASACEAPVGYVDRADDCDDGQAAVSPDASETCNGIDDDCSGQADEGLLGTYSRDADGDGYGDPNVAVQACSAPGGYIANALDCDDSDPDVRPGATETCDGKDNDCDGVPDGFARTCDLGCANGVQTCTAAAWSDCSAPVPLSCRDFADCAFKPMCVEACPLPPPETCNGRDDDCDGEADEGVLVAFHPDLDGDGHGGPGGDLFGCTAPAGHAATDDDCDDTDEDVHPGALEACNGRDDDCDSAVPANEADADIDGFRVCQGDCRDDRAAVHPGAAEVCDGLDGDCDGEVDEGVLSTFYADDDGDGFGDPAAPLRACEAPPGHVADSTDCDDASAAVKPGAVEACNGKDDDCDGAADDGDPGGGGACDTGRPGICGPGVLRCAEGKVQCAQVASASAETCDGKDNDCNGVVDDGDPDGGAACDTGKPGVCAAGVEHCRGGTLRCEQQTQPSDEACNGKDDDCDGVADDGVLSTFRRDKDGDGFGNAAETAQACAPPPGHVADATDCNDSDAAVHPGAAETCDGEDDDCDGVADDGDPDGGAACDTGMPGVCAAGVEHCRGGALRCEQQVQAAAEQCNGKDDDCDGAIDNGNPGGGASCNTGKLGVCAAGVLHCAGGTVQCVQQVYPTGEQCDGKDNDCNGVVDDGDPGGGTACDTGLLGVCAAGVRQCSGGGLQCRQQVQASAEQCNGKDDDCNGAVDNGDPGGGASCNTGKPGVCAAGVHHCAGGSVQCRQQVQPSAEQCNGKDDDCDGAIDNGNPGGGASCNTGKLGVCAAGTTQCSGGSIACNQNVPSSNEICNGKDDDCDGAVDDGFGGQGQPCCQGACNSPFTCSGGTCTCSATVGTTCWSGNLWWTDCQGNRTSIKESCPCGCSGTSCSNNSQYTSACSGGDVWWKDCYGNTTAKKEECVNCTCSGNTCVANDKYSYTCIGWPGDYEVWWESCKGVTTTLKQDCGDCNCVGNQCSTTDSCGNGSCACGETPGTCQADCGPTFLSQDRLGRSTNGNCTSTTSGWHPAGGIVYWSFGTSCSLPSTSNPESYGYEYGRWRFQIKKAGRYQVAVKVPPTGAACNFATTKYTQGAYYIVAPPQGGNYSATVNQRAAIGTEAVVSSSVYLSTGEFRLYLYDKVSDLSSCCDSCGQSIRTFFDYAKLTWVGP